MLPTIAKKKICVILCRLNIILMKKIHPWVTFCNLGSRVSTDWV